MNKLCITALVGFLLAFFMGCTKEKEKTLEDLMREYPGMITVGKQQEKLPVLPGNDLKRLEKFLALLKASHKVNVVENRVNQASRIATGTYTDGEHVVVSSFPPFGTTITVLVRYTYCTKYNSFLTWLDTSSYSTGISMVSASWTQIGKGDAEVSAGAIQYTLRGLARWQFNLGTPIPILGNNITITNAYEIHGFISNSNIPTQADGDPCNGEAPGGGTGGNSNHPWFDGGGGILPHDVPEDPGITIIIIPAPSIVYYPPVPPSLQ